MDKKKIQIAIIVACMLGTVGILYYSFMGNSASDIEVPAGISPIKTDIDSVVDVANPGAVNTGQIPSPTKEIDYGTPTTFPADATLDLSVYNDSDLTSLQDYTPVSITPEEKGREN